MSVEELFAFQEEVLIDWIRAPRAWLLQANPVWGSWETVNWIAIFDTKEQAEAYRNASKLPEPLKPEDNRTEDGYFRTYRPDSLLFDYNHDETRPMIVAAVPWLRYDEVQRNPAPPTGPAPALNNRTSEHLKRYGVDFDRGSGGPYTNMDGVVPEPPPAQRD